MAPYFVILFLAVLLVYAGQRTGRTVAMVAWGATFALLTLFAGLRSIEVGTDSASFARIFLASDTFGHVFEHRHTGFVFVSWIIRLFTREYVFVFLLFAAITYGCYLRAIKRYSIYPTLSLFVFIVGGNYTFPFNLVSQAAAMAIILMGMEAIYNESFKRFFVYVMIASVFHRSAVFILPFYFIVIQKNVTTYVLILIIGTVFVFFFDRILAITLPVIAFEEYLHYLDWRSDAVGLVSTLFLAALALFFIFFRARVKDYRPQYDKLLNMFLLGVVIAAATAYHGLAAGGTRRLSLYLSISSVYLWPIVYRNLSNDERLVFIATFVPLYLLYYYMTTIAFGDVVPYQINPIIW